MLQQMGSSAQRIEGEAGHRPHWREELYPVIFGEPMAPHEILVLLDFANPITHNVWDAVVQASRTVSPSKAKIAVFGNSAEKYGTDLMGFAIWLSYSRKGRGMDYLTWALARWDTIKADQKRLRGAAIPFEMEFDAVASQTDYPMIFDYMNKLVPPVREMDEVTLSRYCYDAGNVNMYQAVQIAAYYGVKKLPAIIVDGKVLPQASADAIVAAVK
ncbi:MAG: hypothetical protein LBR22_03390 [Desulfovibrio sp.]|jgi:hypothetical protein|nr:hypothetical protein [Desulfovibrio sp.]